jgi:hypothetical protein
MLFRIMPITINTNGRAITNSGCTTFSLASFYRLRILEEGGGIRPQTNRTVNRIRLHPLFKMWPVFYLLRASKMGRDGNIKSIAPQLR